jgi:uncharacterized protein YjbI with pentapeptide repeats
MANQEQLNRLLNEGVEAWNKWRKENPDIHIDLRESDLSGITPRSVSFMKADLVHVNFSRTDLTNANLNQSKVIGANLSEAKLNHALFSGTNLTSANLSRADLSESDLGEADFGSANLSNANLSGALFLATYLSRADLTGANLTGAIFAYVTLGDVDLRPIEGLETIRHDGPSTIGTDTIVSSQGDIPEVFLKGAGVSDSIIEYMRSLVGKPIDYYSCFISYSSKDHNFAERIHADLQAKGVRCWLDKEDMKIGEKLRPRIDEAIRRHDKLLLVFSQYSVKSTWVESEVETALDKERRSKQLVLFPIRLDEAVMRTRQAWASTVRRERQIGDFRGWRVYDEYQKAFARLMRDLKA